MRLRTKKKVFRDALAEQTGAFDPWLLIYNSVRYVNPNATDQVGFVTNQQHLASRTLNPHDDLGELFLENTKFHVGRTEWSASIPEYFSSFLMPLLALSGSESIESSEVVSLPEPSPLEVSLGELLQRRHSVRQFSGDPLELEDLSAVLHAAAGITHKSSGRPMDKDVSIPMFQRSVPSAGGLYPIDCYCIALRVRPLAPAVYKYMPHKHALAKIAAESPADAFLSGLLGLESLGIDGKRVAAILAFAGNPQKLVRKYGPRGVRYLLLETGMISMAANLAAVALGYGTLDYQYFVDDRLRDSLSLSGKPHQLLHLLLLGWPAESGSEGSHV